jgi:hypothetical protein
MDTQEFLSLVRKRNLEAAETWEVAANKIADLREDMPHGYDPNMSREERFKLAHYLRSQASLMRAMAGDVADSATKA